MKLMVVTRRLLIFAAVSVLVAGSLFAGSFFFGKRLLVSWMAFECGLVGGFVSIQQRLRKIDDEELSILRESWAAILVIPIFGGIFAQVTYVLFLSGLIQGHLFPVFAIPQFADMPTDENIRALLTQTYPKTGADFAKLMFWCFVSGFSERFVPQIVNKIVRDGTDTNRNQGDGGDQSAMIKPSQNEDKGQRKQGG